MNSLQDLILVCADHRGVLDGAVPRHLPPALLAHHVRLQARRPHRLPSVDRLPGRHFNRNLKIKFGEIFGWFFELAVWTFKQSICLYQESFLRTFGQFLKSIELPPQCAAAPYFLFTRINYIDRPLKSGHFLEDSAFCALLSDNIYPKVQLLQGDHAGLTKSFVDFYLVCNSVYPIVLRQVIIGQEWHNKWVNWQNSWIEANKV